MTPYYSDDSVTLYHADFRDHLDELTADLVVADPPYGETSLEWDRWPTGWPGLLAPVAKSMWCFGSLRMFMTQAGEFADWRFSHEIVWEKHNASGIYNDKFRRIHEFATHWYQGPWSDVHREVPITRDAVARTVTRRRPPAHFGAIGTGEFASENGGPRLRTSVIYAPSMHGKAINETEKPVSVLELLIQYGCPPDGLVVDPFAGSASTLVAALAKGEDDLARGTWWVKDLISRDLPCYKYEERTRTCIAPTPRKAACGRSGSVGMVDRDPLTGEGVMTWFCSRHRDQLAAVQARVKQWVANGQPLPPANSGGVLRRWWDGNWDGIYRWASGRDPMPGGREATPPRPTLRLIQGEGEGS